MEVQVRIKSSQVDASGEKTQINTEAKGTLSLKNGKYYLRYEDTELIEGAAVPTTLKLAGRELLLIRKGAMEQRMEFSCERETATVYPTPYGMLELQIKTTELSDTFSEAEGGSIRLRYELYVNGRWQSRCRMDIEAEAVLS